MYLSRVRLSVDKRKENVLLRVNSLKENYGTMTDIVLLKTHRNLIKLLTTEDDCMENCEFSLKYESKYSNGKLLESMMGRVFEYNSDDIPGVNSKTNSLIWRKLFLLLKGFIYRLFFYFKIFLSFFFFFIGLFSLFHTYQYDKFNELTLTSSQVHELYLFSLLMLFLFSLGYMLVFDCITILLKTISFIWRCLRFVVKGSII